MNNNETYHNTDWLQVEFEQLQGFTEGLAVTNKGAANYLGERLCSIRQWVNTLQSMSEQREMEMKWDPTIKINNELWNQARAVAKAIGACDSSLEYEQSGKLIKWIFDHLTVMDENGRIVYDETNGIAVGLGKNDTLDAK